MLRRLIDTQITDRYALRVPLDVMPFRVHTLNETPFVALRRFEHPRGAILQDSEEQAADQFQINIVEQGWFRLGHEGREWTLGAGCVFLSRPGDLYRYSHLPGVEPDTCLSMAFSAALTGEVAERFNRLSLAPPITNRLNFLQLQLGSIAREDIPMGLETLACELLEATAEAIADRHLYRPRQLEWYAERIRAARERMETDLADQHSLWRLSSAVGMSPFLFARVFRELVGLPPHRYLVRLRLEHARALLRSGMSVTNTCYAAGFNNLSHFIRTFRKHFGCLPSHSEHSCRAQRQFRSNGSRTTRPPIIGS